MNPLPPVVLIHGMWSTPDTLKDLRLSFETQGYCVHVPRLPYHFSLNEMHTENRQGLRASGVDDYVASISQLILTLESPPIVVGHSLGGLLAQLIATKHECKMLILLSSAAPAGINSWSWSVIRTFGHNLFKFPMWQSLINLNKKNIAYGIANSQTGVIKDEIAGEATLESGRVSWQIAMWFLYRKPLTKVDFEKVRCPVLVIGGSHDKITPICVQRKIANKYTHKATLLEVEGACHWTVGGSYFSKVSDGLFSWVNIKNAINRG